MDNTKIKLKTVDGELYLGELTLENDYRIRLKNMKVLKNTSHMNYFDDLNKNNDTVVEFYKANIIWMCNYEV